MKKKIVLLSIFLLTISTLLIVKNVQENVKYFNQYIVKTEIEILVLVIIVLTLKNVD